MRKPQTMSSHYFSNTLKIDSAVSSADKQIVLVDASHIDISALPVSKLLSQFEQSVLAKRKVQAAKQEYIATRLTLKYLLKLSVPAFKNTPEQHKFGFDIEHCTKTRPFVKLAKHFYHQEEVNLISAFNDINEQAGCFFRIWTLKEALAKATAQPIAKLLSPNVFEEIEKHSLTASSRTVNDFDISVVAQKSTDWQCSFMTFDDLRRVLAF